MNDFFKRIMANLIPFLILGIAFALLVGLFIVFSYVLFWGILIGAVLWVISSVREYFRPSKPKHHAKGRIIEHQDHD